MIQRHDKKKKKTFSKTSNSRRDSILCSLRPCIRNQIQTMYFNLLSYAIRWQTIYIKKKKKKKPNIAKIRGRILSGWACDRVRPFFSTSSHT